MRVLVAYESRGGTTRRTGEAIAEAARSQGHTVTVGPLVDVPPADVGTFDALFVGAWIEGFILFGVRPARAAIEWVRRFPPLERCSAPTRSTLGGVWGCSRRHWRPEAPGW